MRKQEFNNQNLDGRLNLKLVLNRILFPKKTNSKTQGEEGKETFIPKYYNLGIKFTRRLKSWKIRKLSIAFEKKTKNNFILTIGKVSLCFFLGILLATVAVPVLANRLNSSPIAGESESLPNSPTLLERGKQKYQNGQFFEAANDWVTVVEFYSVRGETLNQVQALNYLSLAYKELGQWAEAKNAIQTSLNLLENVGDSNEKRLLLQGQALNQQGMLQLLQGETEAALATWQRAETAYDRAGDERGQFIAKINQAQALQALGQYRRAKSILETQAIELQNRPDSLVKARGLRSLGIALQTIGDPLQSKAILERSWEISEQLNSREDQSAAIFSIGNVARDLGRYDVAWTYYQEAVEIASNPLEKAQIQVNQLSLLIEAQEWEAVTSLLPEVEGSLAELPASRSGIYAKLNFAESSIKLQTSADEIGNSINIARLLAGAVQQSRQLRDRRAEAYSLTELGKLYRQQGQVPEARDLTQQALSMAQEMNAADLIARAAGQLGDILSQENETEGAIAAYEIAFNNIQSLRSDLVAVNTDVQYSFKESIEPIYRDYVSALLTPTSTKQVSQNNLRQAREAIEALQLAALDNFFRDACLDTSATSIDEIDIQAAVIYPIILRDRLEVILSIPNQPLSHYTTQFPRDRIEATLKQLFSALSPGYPNDQRLQLSKEVYDWLVKPAETELKRSAISTLVFVPDGFLRNIPMAALYDGEQYLIEQYRVALSPGLQLFARGLRRDNLSVLAAGLTEARLGFNPLPGVNEEMQEIKEEVNPAEILLNQEFTRENFKIALEERPFPIVHLATHGQFSSNPEETFLLAWNDRISIQDFDLLFQKRRLGLVEPIELLVMSACQTAAGDNRATLGLAGFAVRSGARSTIASLWSVSDESTSNLMQEFYRQLTTNRTSKAEALRQAQLKALQSSLHKHPYFWASFVLVGNWL
ncbi:MAG: CHAT domain-containing protein [Cyanobacteriota bacterium]|nr:CHAT domain-containing protein [Cyanobacteriota bacterium]